MRGEFVTFLRSCVFHRAMTSPEVFFLHLQGEQRGPYTIFQIDHLLNSGLIAQETLYWREGLDQWQPVTELVVLRKPANPWIKPAIILAVTLVVAALAQFFGPIAIAGWREVNQHEFTEKAAYWRARGVVRSGAVPAGSLVDFDRLSKAKVSLTPPDAATVLLRGELTDRKGNTAPVVWRVPMQFDVRTGEWTGGPAAKIPRQP